MLVLFKNRFLILFFSFLLFALTLINGQYSSQSQYSNPTQCDHNRLQRCQQDITTNIQDLSGSQSGYSGIATGYQGSGQNSDTHARCSAIRQNLDCLLMYTPPCQHNRSAYANSGAPAYSGGFVDSRNNGGDFVRRAKQTLERYCEQGGGGKGVVNSTSLSRRDSNDSSHQLIGWRSASCFTRQDVRNCESQYSFSSNPPSVSVTSCRNYQDFRDCVVRIVRQSCYSQDLQLMATYLIDKASDLSWSCLPNQDYGNPPRGDGIYNSNDPYRSGSGYQDRDRNNYGSNYGTNYGTGGQYDRDRTYDRDRINDRNDRYGVPQYGGSQYGSGGSQYGGSQYGSGGSQYGGSQYGQYDRNQPIDRFSSGGYPMSDTCLEKAGYFVRSCEDTLVQRQRDAREGRSSNDVQRRICCALFFFRDCISRVVVDRCRDPSPTVVDILMGSRKRDLTVTCREYSRDQCSGSSMIYSSFSVLLSIFISVLYFKPNIF